MSRVLFSQREAADPEGRHTELVATFEGSEPAIRAAKTPSWTDHLGQRVDPNHVEQMSQGVVPNHYTRVVTCRQCGPTWSYELVMSADERGVVPECPWCQVREAGLAIPRPPEPWPTYDIGTTHEGIPIASAGVPKAPSNVRSLRQRLTARRRYRNAQDGTKE